MLTNKEKRERIDQFHVRNSERYLRFLENNTKMSDILLTKNLLELSASDRTQMILDYCGGSDD